MTLLGFEVVIFTSLFALSTLITDEGTEVHVIVYVNYPQIERLCVLDQSVKGKVTRPSPTS